MTSTLEDLARSDFDRAQAAYEADKSSSNLAAYIAATNAYENLAAYIAATNAYEAAVRRSMQPRACYFCVKALSAHAGFIETIRQPDGLRRDFCSAECLHWQLHEDEKAE